MKLFSGFQCVFIKKFDFLIPYFMVYGFCFHWPNCLSLCSFQPEGALTVNMAFALIGVTCFLVVLWLLYQSEHKISHVHIFLPPKGQGTVFHKIPSSVQRSADLSTKRCVSSIPTNFKEYFKIQHLTALICLPCKQFFY